METAGIFRELHATVIPVLDLVGARAFYGGVLELELVKDIPDVLAVFATGGGTHICVFRPETDEEGPASGGAFPNFRSDDIAATHAHLTAHGVACGAIQMGDPLSWFQFRDPFGNRIDVCAYGSTWLP